MKLFVVYLSNPNKFNYFIVNNELETQMITKDTKSSNWDEDKLIKAGLFRLDNLHKKNKINTNLILNYFLLI